MTFVAPGVLDAGSQMAFDALANSAAILHVGPTAPTLKAGGAARNVPDWKRWFDTSTLCDKIWSPNASLWINLTPQSNRVAANETTATTTYGDNLTTVGPSVTVDTGTEVLVQLSARISNDNGLGTSLMSFAVSGATTLVAADGNSIQNVGQPNKNSLARMFRLTGLTAGANTFKCVYRVIAGTGTWEERSITIFGRPT